MKTWILIAALGGLFVAVGSIWGTNGMIIALVLALGFNFAMYWFSDKIAIATSRSKPVTEQEHPDLYRIVRELTQARGLPMPRVYVSDMMQPNAFATGRNPRHAAVAVTKGILQLCDERELRGVLAHELSHVANHDILTSSIAAGIGMSITFLARFAFFFGGSEDNNGPEALASALRKLESAAQQIPPPATLAPSEAHLFIMNPFKGRAAQRVGFANLFSTHPPTPARIQRLEEIKTKIGTAPGQPLID